MLYGIKFAQQGQKFTTTDSDKLSIDSSNFALKIIDSDPKWVKSVNITGGYDVAYTIQHNRGYIPLYDFYFKALDGSLTHMPGRSNDSNSTRGMIFSETVNEIVARVGNPSGTPANTKIDVYQMIFLDPEQ